MMERIKAQFIKHRRIIIYAVVGGTNTLVDFLMYTLLHALTLLPAELCQGAGYLTGVACSFFLNHNITFKDGAGGSLTRQITRFIAVNALSMGSSMLVIHWLVSAGVNGYLAKIPVTVLAAAVNYLGYKIFVFKVKD